MKATDLRQAILQAAVQGKLVPQNDQDEPAVKLLERVQQEKAQLVKEGKIKKEKPFPTIAEEEMPYDLPDGWVWCRLGEITLLITSGSRDWAKYYSKDGAIFLRMGNLSKDSLDLRLDSIQHVDPPHNSEGNRTKLEANDILVSITGEVGSLGRIPDGFGEAYINQHTALVRFPQCLQNRYFPFAFLSPFCKNQFDKPQRGIKNSFRLTDLSYMLVPLPPLAEQERIAIKVDELIALCDELEAAEKELDAVENLFVEYLPKSILQAAVQGKLVPQNIHDEPASELLKRIQQEKARLVREGKIKKEKALPPIVAEEIPYDLPDGWAWCRLGEICIVNPRNQVSDDIDVAFVPMPLISSEYFGGHSQEARKWGDVKHGFTHYAENDVVVAKITPCFQNGKSCVMRKLTNGFGAGTTELHVLRCIEIIPEYLLIYVKNPSFLIAGEVNMTGTAGQQRIPTDYLKSCLFPMPPLSEQQRIVAKVDELIALCDELKKAREFSHEKKPSSNVVLFPQKTDEDEQEIGFAARGDATPQFSPKLRGTMVKLLEDDVDECS